MPLRSKAVTGSFAPVVSRFITAGRLSSGTVKITVIGCNWVMTTMRRRAADLDVVAEIDLAQPDAAVTGETMWQ